MGCFLSSYRQSGDENENEDSFFKMMSQFKMKKGNFEVFPRWKQLFVRIGVVDQHDKFYFFQETTTGEGNSESSKLGT